MIVIAPVEPDRLDRPDPRRAAACATLSRRPGERGTPIVAVSPIVGGRALKGPADRMLASLGHESTALGVARLYRGLVATGFVLDAVDAALAPAVEALGLRTLVTDTLMVDDAGRGSGCAREVLAFARSIRD